MIVSVTGGCPYWLGIEQVGALPAQGTVAAGVLHPDLVCMGVVKKESGVLDQRNIVTEHTAVI